AHRNRFFQSAQRRSMGRGRDLEGMHADGHKLALELGLYPVQVADEQWVIVTAVEISGRQAVESAARTVLRAAGSAMLLVNRQGRIVFANPECTSVFGYSLTELRDITVDQLVPQDIAAAHAGLRQSFFGATESRTMAEGKPLFARAKDGSEFRVEVALAPMDYGGEPVVLATVVDLSLRLANERAQADRDAAARVADELRDQHQALRQVVNAASHDLKGPLTSIAGLAMVAGEQLAADDTEELQEHLERIAEMAHNAAARTEALRETVTLKRARESDNAIDLAPLVEQVWAQRPGADAAIRLELDIADTAPLHCDRDLLLRVLTYLVDNACRFQSPACSDRWVGVRSRQHRDSLVITVSDNGVGIPPGQREAVFEPFVRLDSRAGDGLGLTQARTCAREMGGRISVAGREPHGSDFHVHLALPRSASIASNA
ncbi:MAG: PAS domain-containing sensor histidine kinase, partial [Pseudomonadota bacterium]